MEPKTSFENVKVVGLCELRIKKQCLYGGCGIWGACNVLNSFCYILNPKTAVSCWQMFCVSEIEILKILDMYWAEYWYNTINYNI